MTHFEIHSAALPHRIQQGFERLSVVLRADQWSASHAVGLNPTQAGVLAFLAGRDKVGARVKEIAAHLGVSAPSATDTISALEKKNLVERNPDATDARAVGVRITHDGKAMLKAVGLVGSNTEQALSTFSVSEQADLFLLVVKLIRQLQVAGAISNQRMCVTCTHFRPNFYPGAKHPHHCAFVNAAFETGDLRIDCGDHETADPAVQATTWAAFENRSASLQAM
jgi:DNA-binding MarR family transcriptional regulator